MSDDDAKTLPHVQAPHATMATIVDGSSGTRARVPIVSFDEAFVSVDAVGEVKRFSRQTGFEIPPGGSWSAWRLAGRDLRRWRIG